MSDAIVKIGADTSGFQKGLSAARGSMSSFAREVATIASGQALFAGLQAVISAAGSALQGLSTLFKESVASAGEYESVVAQFTTFYKSADLAKGAIAELSGYADVTAFQLSEVAAAGASLAGVGVPAEQLKESIRVLGDTAAATKRTLADTMLPYLKVLSVGKMQTETFLQFLERGIPIGEQLKKSLNLGDNDFRKQLEKGISAQDVVSALQEITTTGMFSGAATAQGKTLNGLISTLNDNIEKVKRNLGLAAANGLKPLIAFAQSLVEKLAPLGESFGNIFTAASDRALVFSEQFKAAFAKAVDFSVNAFQIVEGAIKNGTLWQIFSTGAMLAWNEIETAGVRVLNGLQEVFDSADLMGAAMEGFNALMDYVKSEMPGIAAVFASAWESPLFSAMRRAAESFGTYLKEQIDFAMAGLADIVTPDFLKSEKGGGLKLPSADINPSYVFAGGGVTSDQAAEMVAAARAGYPTPLMPSEVRSTFANGKRITYNTRESVQNGMIIPPANSDAFAEGGAISQVQASFQQGYARQTTILSVMQVQNERLRQTLEKLLIEAKKSSTAIKEQTAGLKSTTELTGRKMEEETKKASKARRGEDDKFTSLEKLGGGRGRINLAAGPVIPLEGKAPGLRGAGDLGAGFGASWQFKAARGDWMKAREMKPEIAAQGPPALNFNDNLNRKLERMGGAALDAQIRGMSPFGGGIQGNLAEKLLERLLRVTEDALAIQSRTLDAPVV